MGEASWSHPWSSSPPVSSLTIRNWWQSVLQDRRPWPWRLFGWCLSALPAASTVHQSAAQQPAASAESDPAHELFIQTCNRCHDAARITALRRTKTEWEEVINKMIERGATGSEEDFVTVFGYLRRHYGKVFINSATSDEITTTLRLSSKDAVAF